MNPLTQIKNTQKVSRQEIEQGVPESASWHARFKHSAYVYAGGLPFDLTEGDTVTIFSQYGEIMDVHNVKDRETGKFRGFAFLAYQDQRSTVLAVDNLNGAVVSGRTIRVEHVDNYRKKKAEVEGVEEAEAEEELNEAEAAAAEEQRAMQAAAAAAGATFVDTAGAQQRTEPAGDAPWAGPNSIAALMQEADRQMKQTLPPPPVRPAAAAAERHEASQKEHKAKKEKKAKKGKSDRRRKVADLDKEGPLPSSTGLLPRDGHPEQEAQPESAHGHSDRGQERHRKWNDRPAASDGRWHGGADREPGMRFEASRDGRRYPDERSRDRERERGRRSPRHRQTDSRDRNR